MMYENINIDITPDSFKLTYSPFEQLPVLSEKSGFTLKRSEETSEQDFRSESFKLLNEALRSIDNNTFKEFLNKNDTQESY